MLNAVIIPIYQATVSDGEQQSLAQCCKIFVTKPILFVAPENLDVSIYQQIAGAKKIEFVFFPEKYFRSIESYSLLLMSPLFYQRFAQFKYILIYQLDAYAFRDELDAWCDRGYDYIGAPWLKKQNDDSITEAGVGNGGFSLRRVQAFLDLGRGRAPAFFSTKELMSLHYANISKSGSALEKMLVSFKLAFKALGLRNNLAYYAKHYTEDDFWCGIAPQASIPIRIAPFSEALKFAFESHPEYLYSKNGDQLPFGCHAWLRYNPKFWETFIK